MPNFDDVDLAIIAILVLGICFIFKVSGDMLTTGFGACVTAIAALARGKK